MHRISIFLVAISMCSSGCLGWVESNPEFYGEVLTDSFVPVFELESHDGSVFNSTTLEGKVVIFVFVYTRCPDICPVTSQNVAYVYENLGDRKDQVEVVSLTVDPWADDSTTLNQYVIDQNLSWPHLTGPVEQMEPVWSAFGVGLTTYSDDTDGDGVVDGFDTCPDTPKDEPLDHHGCGIDTQGGEQENSTAGSSTSGRHALPGYWVDHMTGTILIDRNMQQRVFWGDIDWNPDFVIDDIDVLLAE